MVLGDVKMAGNLFPYHRQRITFLAGIKNNIMTNR